MRFVRLRPSNPAATRTIKKAKKAIISPIIAATICFRASSTFVLSPPEVIQRIPPKTKKKIDIITAIIKIIVIALLTMLPMLLNWKLHRT